MQKPLSHNPYDVLGIGSAFVDRILPVSHKFISSLNGEKGGASLIEKEELDSLISQASTKETLLPGGSAANTLRGLTSLGHTCALRGTVGSDSLGKLFLSEMEHLKITPLLHSTPSLTGQVVCFVGPDGERTQRVFRGGDHLMNPELLDPLHFQGVRLVFIEGFAFRNPGVVERAAILGKEEGALVALGCASFEVVREHKDAMLHVLKEFVDVLFANEEEAHALTGHISPQACQELSSQGPVTVITLGKEGSWIGWEGKIEHSPTTPIQPIDSTGAGDLFASGFLHGYLNQVPLPMCAEMGSMAAAAVIQSYGPQLPPHVWTNILRQCSKYIPQDSGPKTQVPPPEPPND